MEGFLRGSVGESFARPGVQVPSDLVAVPLADVGHAHSNVRLSPAVVQVTAEESDPVGEYVTRVEVTDRVRGVTLTLVRRFTLEK
jgi:hypothetical protein